MYTHLDNLPPDPGSFYLENGSHQPVERLDACQGDGKGRIAKPFLEFDRDHVLATLQHLHEPGELIELRHFVSGGGMLGSFSHDPNRIVDIAQALNGRSNIFATVNPVDPDLAVLGEASRKTTGNEHILKRRWLFLDFDPGRPSGTAATDTQFSDARKRARECTSALTPTGWPQPTAAYSGNGVHLLYAVDLENTLATVTLFREFTDAVAHRWSDDVVGVDRVVHNAARIIKLWGTKSVKGKSNDPERPHRYSQMMSRQPRILVTEEMMRNVIAEWGEKPKAKRAMNAPDPEAPIRRPGRPRKDQASEATAPQFEVQQWLEHMGIPVRDIVAEADRTMYILQNCVFNPEHVAKDAAIFVSNDGQHGYHCFHNSCAEKTWADVRAKYDAAYAGRRAVIEGGLPMVQVNDRRAVDVINDVVARLAENNDPPTLFQSDGHLLTLRQSGGGMGLTTLNLDLLRVEAVQRISFVQHRKGKDGITYSAVWPNRDLLQSVLSLGTWPGIPVCDMVTRVPLVAADGTIHNTLGYNAATRAYLTTDEFAFECDPATITREEALAARDWLLERPLEGFPFMDKASKAHALAAMIQHSVGRVINANTPLYLLDASRPGSGKGLLAEVICRAAGTLPKTMTLPTVEEERQKTIISTLLQHPTHVVLDNVKGQVDSPALEALLTAPVYSGRLLGASQVVELVVTGTTWMMTANNATFSPDLTTRSAYIRLEPQCEDPTQRTDFKIHDLPAWLDEHQAELVGAVLTITGYWVGQGMLCCRGKQKHRLGRWRDVMGGIMECIGMGDAFLANTDDLRHAADTETAAWNELVSAWLDVHKTNMVKVGALMDIAFGTSDPITKQRTDGPLELLVSAPTDNQRRVRLGLLLKGKHGAIYQKHRIQVNHDPHGNSMQLVRVGANIPISEQIDRICPPRPEMPPKREKPVREDEEYALDGDWDDSLSRSNP